MIDDNSNKIKNKNTPNDNFSLYIVATPIGNSRDITLRALDILRKVSLIACEDTRRTKKLLSIHNITTPCAPYHEHNAHRVTARFLRALDEGQKIALVSDAGMPCISDPGHLLIDECHKRNLSCSVIGGISAVTSALALSGFACDVFYFAGFPPRKKGKRQTWLKELHNSHGAIVLFESPYRLRACLEDLAQIFPQRQGAIMRELTKMHEDIRRGSFAKLKQSYQGDTLIKGEVTIVISPPVKHKETS